MTKKTSIELTPYEIQSGLDRVYYAELLIRQLPENHDGRNTWLLNYGRAAAEKTILKRRIELARQEYLTKQAEADAARRAWEKLL